MISTLAQKGIIRLKECYPLQNYFHKDAYDYCHIFIGNDAQFHYSLLEMLKKEYPDTFFKIHPGYLITDYKIGLVIRGFYLGYYNE